MRRITKVQQPCDIPIPENNMSLLANQKHLFPHNINWSYEQFVIEPNF